MVLPKMKFPGKNTIVLANSLFLKESRPETEQTPMSSMSSQNEGDQLKSCLSSSSSDH